MKTFVTLADLRYVKNRVSVLFAIAPITISIACSWDVEKMASGKTSIHYEYRSLSTMR